jgi:hypothetical protein
VTRSNTDTLLSRAAEAKRASRKVEFMERFDPQDDGDWAELVRDIAAMANSGGGVVVVGASNTGTPTGEDVQPVLELDPARIQDELFHDTGVGFERVSIHAVERAGQRLAAIVVGAVEDAPLVFVREQTAFARGSVYVRRGARSTPATTQDLRAFVDRRLKELRKQWVRNIRDVMTAPEGAQMAVVEATEADGDQPSLIRLTSDPSAQLYGKLDPDRTHPYRQTEVIREVTRRLPADVSINAFVVLSVRRVHDIREATRPEFVHEPKFGSPQYSDAFVEWLLEEHAADPRFFESAKAVYNANFRPRRRSRREP